MRKKSGFTLIEAIVTVGILGISSAMTILVMTSLVRVQDAAADESLVNGDFQTLDSTVNSYISLVSQKNSVHSFTYKSTSSSSLVYSLATDDFTLSYSNPNISISTTYSGSDESLKVSQVKELSNISNVEFDFDASINLLIVKATARGTVNKFTYVVRV